MDHEHSESTVAWPLALGAAAVLGTLATACMMPFVAIATLAAATMGRGRAVAALLGVWVVNQLLGFGLLGYPMTGNAFYAGVALGASSLAALAVARGVLGRRTPTFASLATAFATGFVTYEGLLFLLLAAVGGGTGNFTPAIILRILANDLAWLVGLSALHLVLTRAAPRVFGAPAQLPLA